MDIDAIAHQHATTPAAVAPQLRALADGLNAACIEDLRIEAALLGVRPH